MSKDLCGECGFYTWDPDSVPLESCKSCGREKIEENSETIRITVSIYYPGGEIPRGDLARRLEGLEWWISTEEKLPPGKLKVIDLTTLKDR